MRPFTALGLCLVAMTVVATGCSSELNEKTLPGTWQGSGDGTGMALKIKSEQPSANSAQVRAAAKILSATSLEIKDDSTYSLNYGVNKFGGTWKFDKEAAFVEMDVKTQNGEPATPDKALAAGFLGIVNQKDGTMKLFNGERKMYEDLKQRGDKGADLLNVKLRKQ